MIEKDYRLYYYKDGTLRKWGSFKKGHARIRHFYTDLSEIEDGVNWLLMVHSKYNYQFLIIEYEAPYKSKIIKIIG